MAFRRFIRRWGRRGYVLDELQPLWSALTFGLVLGPIWALWHTPAFLIPGLARYETGGVSSWTYACSVASVTLGSLIYTWVYDNSGRSVLVAGILMHFVQNATLVFLAGIFDGFNLRPAHWPVLLGVTAAVSAALVLACGPLTLAAWPGQRADEAAAAG